MTGGRIVLCSVTLCPFEGSRSRKAAAMPSTGVVCPSKNNLEVGMTVNEQRHYHYTWFS